MSCTFTWAEPALPEAVVCQEMQAEQSAGAVCPNLSAHPGMSIHGSSEQEVTETYCGSWRLILGRSGDMEEFRYTAGKIWDRFQITVLIFLNYYIPHRWTIFAPYYLTYMFIYIYSFTHLSMVHLKILNIKKLITP